MAQYPLTPNACARLGDHDDFPALVSCPTLIVKDIKPWSEKGSICGFTMKHEAVLVDGKGEEVHVCLPVDLEIDSADASPRFAENDVVKIQRMLRLPVGNNSIILVHGVQVCGPDYELNISKMDEEQRKTETKLEKERTLRERAEAALRDVVENHGVAPQLIDSAVQALIRISDLVDSVMMED